ncbi:hypothetical protein [Cerasicoccus frondis]|uniref:hypothetical protein n=1 Tax=Cerasicoccus frondis TaxID=490090 RepID=UPI00285294B8|nr:hypothetical protein [Cerasicoccus frondis]
MMAIVTKVDAPKRTQSTSRWGPWPIAIFSIGMLCAWFGFFFVAKPLPFFSYFHDPELTYILNARQLLADGSVSHTDHPGTALQMVGSGMHLALGNEVDDMLHDDVINSFRNAWRWLSLASAIFLILLASRCFSARPWQLLVALGLLIFDPNTAFYWTTFTPEGALITLYLPAALLAMMRFCKKGRLHWAECLGWGLLMGALTTLKITFWPLTLFLAFCLLATREKLDKRAYLAPALFFGAAILTYFPLGSLFAADREAQWAWFMAMLTNSGRYGSGETGVLPLADILAWARQGYASQGYFPLLIIVLCIGLGLMDIIKGKLRARILAVGMMGSASLSYLLFAKHPYQIKYLLPLAPLFFLYWCARPAGRSSTWPALAKLLTIAALTGVGVNALAAYSALHHFTLLRHEQVLSKINAALNQLQPEQTYFSHEIQHPLAAKAFAVYGTPYFQPQLDKFALHPHRFSERQAGWKLESGHPLPIKELPSGALVFTSGVFIDPRVQPIFADEKIGLGLCIYVVK